MKYFMGFTKHGDRTHIVPDNEQKTSLCGRPIDTFVTPWLKPGGIWKRSDTPIVMDDHWEPGSRGSTDDNYCGHCVGRWKR